VKKDRESRSSRARRLETPEARLEEVDHVFSDVLDDPRMAELHRLARLVAGQED
jgi:hypothetical protein